VTRAELQTKIDELTASIAEQKTAHEAVREALAQAEADLEKAADDYAKLEQAKTEAVDAAEQMRQELAQAVADRNEQQEHCEELLAQIQQLQDAIETPANIDAALVPSTAAIAVADAELQALDETAKADDDEMTITERYEAMPAGAERVAFYQAHRAQILRGE